MKTINRLTCFFLVLILLAGMVSCSRTFNSHVITGTFNYMPAFEDTADESFTYSDSFFSKSGKTDDPQLLLMSCDLALSTFEIRNSTYVTKLYEDIGFGRISVADMVEKPSKDSIGTAIACKKAGGYNIVAVAIRGEKYDSEWASNFVVGKSGNAKGFDDASVKVLERIRDYIGQNKLKNNKIWIVGYSRAGAVADLAGVYINNHLSEFGTTEDDLYIYAFEPPAASADNTVWQNIHVVVNKNDPIPYLYPSSWGLHTNGKITEISTPQTVMTYTNLTEPAEYGEKALDELLKNSFDWLSGRISRERYAEDLEGPISDLLELFFSKSEEERTIILSYFRDDVFSPAMNDPDLKGKLLMPAWSAMSHYSDHIYRVIADLIVGYMDEVRAADNSHVLTDEEYIFVTDRIYPVIRALGPVIIDDMHFCEGIDYDYLYQYVMPDYLMGEVELGTKYGSDAGSDNGYSDGFYGAEFNDQPSYFEESDSPEYVKAYTEAYEKEYSENYELGKSHAADLVEKGKYDGGREGERDGFTNGKEGDERKPFNEYFWQEDWMTDEYIAAYNKAYEEKYNEGYDKGTADTSEEIPWPEFSESYHILSFAKNISTILKNHYGQTNLALIKEWTSEKVK